MPVHLSPSPPRAPGPLRLGRRSFGPDELVLMAIINRTPDSFFDRGATWAEDAALRTVREAVTAGADIVDIGGIKAAPGVEISAAEEADRVVPFIAAVRAEHPELVISVDTWRAGVATAAVEAGADLVNDAWGGVDRDIGAAAAAGGAGLVCTHAGHLPPRTRPHRVSYPDIVADVVETLTGLAERAAADGVRPDGILIDPGHDFGKNSRHSLEVTRRLPELTATGWPVLVAMSNKDFLGEILDAGVDERHEATLAATAVAAWLGARVFRAHAVQATRRVLDTVSALHGDRDLVIGRRGLA
jgi:dihydropteroate synthase